MESIVINRRITKWKNLKQRLGLKAAMGCCGATWSPSPRARISTLEEEEEEEEEEEAQRHEQRVIIRSNGNAVNCLNIDQDNSGSTPLLQVGQQQVPTSGSGTGMNLAMALEAERNLRTNNNNNNNLSPTSEVKTLMRLIEETEGVDWNNKKKMTSKHNTRHHNVNVELEAVGGGRRDWVCCVCMERKKGAAFIPCGHTFCRVCSREVWLHRGSCPVCNRSILDILHLF